MSSRFLHVDYSFRSQWHIFSYSKKHPITEKITSDFLWFISSFRIVFQQWRSIAACCERQDLVMLTDVTWILFNSAWLPELTASCQQWRETAVWLIFLPCSFCLFVSDVFFFHFLIWPKKKTDREVFIFVFNLCYLSHLNGTQLVNDARVPPIFGLISSPFDIYCFYKITYDENLQN